MKPLTVGQLLRILAAEDPAKLVVLSSDPEGNSYHTLHSVSASLCYDPKSREVGLDELTPQAIRLGYTDADVLRRAKPAVVLYP